MFLSTKSSSVTVDAVQQRVIITPKPLLFKTKTPRIISFEEIEQVYLDYWEENYTIPDEYTSKQRIRRRWAVILTLRNGQTVTVGEETSDHRVGETAHIAHQHAHWDLAACLSTH